MIELPILIYKETEPQVVPDLNNAESLETSLPIVFWGGKQVQIKQVLSKYFKMDANHASVQRRRLAISLIDIIGRIQKSHPDYLRSCLNS